MLWQQYTGLGASRLNKAQRSGQALRWPCILRGGPACFSRAPPAFCCLRGVCLLNFLYCVVLSRTRIVLKTLLKKSHKDNYANTFCFV